MKLLLVDDDPDIHRFVNAALPKDRFEVASFTTAEEAWEHLDAETFHLALIDWFLPGMSGLELCSRIRSRPDGDSFYLILFTAHHNKESLEAVLAGGADDYLVKPLDLHLFRIRMGLARGHASKLQEKKALEERVKALEDQIPQSPRFHGLVGTSKAMGHMFTLIRELAKVDASVLITGETGTGKELVARALHAESPRKRGPFIPVNCGGLSEHLVASQLFGHRRGSFTGAISDQHGVFEAADGGTLFLDEIGDLPLGLQANFLRVLESREVTRIGENKPRAVNVRVVSATHRDLAKMTREDTFRDDLLYRIKIARVDLPPLRDRREDIPYLVHHFLKLGTPFGNTEAHSIEKGAVDRLMAYSWPGNVRELKNAVAFAMIRSGGASIRSEDLPPEILHGEIQVLAPALEGRPTPNDTGRSSFDEKVLARYRDSAGDVHATARHFGLTITALYRKSPNTFQVVLDRAMEETGGNLGLAAEIMGLSRATLYRRLKTNNDQMDSGRAN